jgi:hypothetical protein
LARTGRAVPSATVATTAMLTATVREHMVD